MCNLMLSISVLTRHTQLTKEKPRLWPGQIFLTRSGTSPGSGLICLTNYKLSKIPDLKDLNFFQPCIQVLTDKVRLLYLDNLVWLTKLGEAN